MSPNQQSNYYIMVAADVDKTMIREPSAYQVAHHRLKIGKWGLRHRTMNRLNLKKGDLVIAYAAGKREHGGSIVGYAVLDSNVLPLKNSLSSQIDSPTSNAYIVSEYYVKLKYVHIFQTHTTLRSLKDTLKFVKRPQSPKWGAMLQNGCVKILKSDYQTIIRKCL